MTPPFKRLSEPSLAHASYVLEAIHERGVVGNWDERELEVIRYFLDKLREDSYGFYF